MGCPAAVGAAWVAPVGGALPAAGPQRFRRAGAGGCCRQLRPPWGVVTPAGRRGLPPPPRPLRPSPAAATVYAAAAVGRGPGAPPPPPPPPPSSRRGVAVAAASSAADRLACMQSAVTDTRAHHAVVTADLLAAQSHSLLLEAMVEDMETMATLLEEDEWPSGAREVVRAADTADGVAASLRLMVADMVGVPPSAVTPLPAATPAAGLGAAGGGSGGDGGGGGGSAAPPSAMPAVVAARLRDAVDAFCLYRRRYLRPLCATTGELLRQSAAALDRGDTVLAETAAAAMASASAGAGTGAGAGSSSSSSSSSGCGSGGTGRGESGGGDDDGPWAHPVVDVDATGGGDDG